VRRPAVWIGAVLPASIAMIRGGAVRRELTDIAELKHDPETWKPVSEKIMPHQKRWSAQSIQSEAIVL
jgi:hypothetical protein